MSLLLLTLFWLSADARPVIDPVWNAGDANAPVYLEEPLHRKYPKLKLVGSWKNTSPTPWASMTEDFQ